MIKSQIIKLDVKNIDDVYEILHEAFNDEAWNMEQLLSSFNNSSNAYYGMVLNGKIVSIISLLITVDDINILDIATKNDYKNKGYATRLIDYVKSIKNEAQTISLEVKESNDIAINFYKKQGFYPVCKRKKYYRTGEDAIIMFYN